MGKMFENLVKIAFDSDVDVITDVPATVLIEVEKKIEKYPELTIEEESDLNLIRDELTRRNVSGYRNKRKASLRKTAPPTWVTDESKWKKAKESATEQGRTEDWEYITGIYKNMGGEIKGKSSMKRQAQLQVGDEVNDEEGNHGVVQEVKEFVEGTEVTVLWDIGTTDRSHATDLTKVGMKRQAQLQVGDNVLVTDPEEEYFQEPAEIVNTEPNILGITLYNLEFGNGDEGKYSSDYLEKVGSQKLAQENGQDHTSESAMNIFDEFATHEDISSEEVASYKKRVEDGEDPTQVVSEFFENIPGISKENNSPQFSYEHPWRNQPKIGGLFEEIDDETPGAYSYTSKDLENRIHATDASQSKESRQHMLINGRTVLGEAVKVLEQAVSPLRKIAWIRSANFEGIKIGKLAETGELQSGQVNFWLDTYIPKPERHSRVFITVAIKEGELVTPTEFYTSAGQKFALTQEGLKHYLDADVDAFGSGKRPHTIPLSQVDRTLLPSSPATSLFENEPIGGTHGRF
jgi:hypothetical protein